MPAMAISKKLEQLQLVDHDYVSAVRKTGALRD